MRSRPWIVIVVIGVLGVAALGLVTHFALENNRSLQEVGSFKTALLERYRDRGVEEVSYRVEHRRGEARSVALHLVTRRADLTSRDRIHSDIGEFFITEFPRATSKLRLRWSQPSFWGSSRTSRSSKSSSPPQGFATRSLYERPRERSRKSS